MFCSNIQRDRNDPGEMFGLLFFFQAYLIETEMHHRHIKNREYLIIHRMKQFVCFGIVDVEICFADMVKTRPVILLYPALYQFGIESLF